MVKVIAEFCQNHNGSSTLLSEMIHRAAENGATYGKIQTIFADDLARRERFENGVVENDKTLAIKRPYEPEYERLKGLELNYEEQFKFVEECKKYGLKPLTTCFTRGSVSRIAELGMTDIKVASYDCGALPLIKDLAAKFDNLIISTGATYDEEIRDTANYLNSIEKNFAFLHCVTIYPTPLSEIHLNRMTFLKEYTSKIGLSEHTLFSRDRVKACLGAIYLGAEYIERHFTVLNADESKDGPVSITSEGLKEISDFANLSKENQKQYLDAHVPEFQEMMGSETRELSDIELLNRDYYRGRFATHRGDEVIYNWEDREF